MTDATAQRRTRGRAAMAALAAAALLGAGSAWSQPNDDVPGRETPGLGAPEISTPEVSTPETAAPDVQAEYFFTGESWRALVAGKTLYYATSEGLVGREYYPPGGQRAVFEYAGDQSCYEGVWREEDGVFCFNYDGEHCFFHLRRGEDIFARQMNGVDQKVVKMTDERLSCAAGLTS